MLRIGRRWGGLIVLWMAAVLPSIAATQVRGVVLETGGTPQRDVLVELWSPVAVVARERTDEAGRFAFDAGRTGGAVRLVLSRTGLQHRSIPLAAGDSVLSLRVRSEAIPLAGVIIRPHRESLCPARGEPAARELWQAMASRYDAESFRLGRGSRAVQVDEEVEPWALVPPSPPYERPGVRLLAGTRTDRDHWWSFGADTGAETSRATITRVGYAWRLTESFDPAYAAWRYEDLGAGNAIHWITAEFGALHGFFVVARDQGETLVAFCPQGDPRARPTIEGILTIGPDSTLVQASWRFHTPKPDEEAGGDATFFPPGPSMPVRALLPREDLFWRRTSHGRYFQRWRQYDQWVFSEDGEEPIFRVPSHASSPVPHPPT